MSCRIFWTETKSHFGQAMVPDCCGMLPSYSRSIWEELMLRMTSSLRCEMRFVWLSASRIAIAWNTCFPIAYDEEKQTIKYNNFVCIQGCARLKHEYWRVQEAGLVEKALKMEDLLREFNNIRIYTGKQRDRKLLEAPGPSSLKRSGPTKCAGQPKMKKQDMQSVSVVV